MATLYPPTGSSGDYSKAYIPDLADSANILTAFKNFYYGTTNGNTDLTKGIYGALETLYYGNPVLAGTLTVDGNLVINGTTTTVNSNEISIIDKNIELGKVEEQTDIAGTVSNISGTGPWTATMTTTTDVQVIPGQSLTQVSGGTGTLYGGSPTSVLVTTVTGQNLFTYTVTGGTIPTVGTVTSFTIGGATEWTANGAGIIIPTGTSTSVDFKYYYTGSPSLTTWLTSQGIHSNSQITSGSFRTSQAQMSLFAGTGSSALSIVSSMQNLNGQGSTVYKAYSNNSDEFGASGWVDFGITGSTFGNGSYTITKKNDGYVFVQPVSGSGLTGNLVLATGGNGTEKSIIFGTGGFLEANERFRIDSTGKITTASSSTGNTNAINIGTGATSFSGGSSGNLNISTGAATGISAGTSGSIIIATPQPSGSGSGIAGNISITAANGSGSSGVGGSVTIRSGSGVTSGAVNINDISGASTTNIAGTAIGSGVTKNVNIGTGASAAGTTNVGIANNAADGSTVNIGIGSSLGTSTTTINGTLVLEDDLPIVYGGTGASTAPAAMANLMGYTTTATAAGTTTLTNTSSYYQQFTGTSTQTVVLPSTATLQTGWSFHIVNNSTGNVSVQSSTAVSLITVIPGTTAMVTCVSTANNLVTAWESGITDFSTYTGTGSVVMQTSPTVVAPTLTGISTTDTLRVTDLFVDQATPIAETATATLTIAELLTKIITVTSSTAVTLTLPTGALTDAGINATGAPAGTSFDWSIINLGSSTGAVTLNAAATGHTRVGSGTVAIGTSGLFRTRKTAASTFVTYRIA